VDDCKRIPLEAGNNTAKTNSAFPILVTNHTYNIPTQLTREYITRHALSKPDVEKILFGVSIYELPAFAMSLGIGTNQLDHVSWATSKSSNQYDLTIVDKKGLLQLITTRLFETVQISHDVGDKLICPFDDHQPPLPVHFIDAKILEALAAQVVFSKWKWILTPEATSNMSETQFAKTALVPRLLILTGKTVSESETKDVKNTIIIGSWQNMLWIPFTFYKGYLQMMHIVPKSSEYNGPLLCKPFEFLLENMVYQTTGESILLQTEQGHQEITKLTEDTLVQSRFSESLFSGSSSMNLPPGGVAF
jgi:hypothetical protein